MILAAAAVLAFASTRVLAYEIDCGSTDRSLIKAGLSESGVYLGMPAKELHPAEVSKRLDSITGVFSSEVFLNGVILCIKITESSSVGSDSASAEEGSGAPIGIFASKDCVIADIDPARGRAMAAAGQAVKAGDILISGDYTDLKPGYYVDAEGSVFGRVLYRAEASASLSSVKLCRTGNYVTVSSVSFFGNELMPAAPYEEYELERVDVRRFVCSPIPVGVAEYRCYELLPMMTEIDESEAALAAKAEAQARLLESLPEGARLISIRTETTTGPDGSVTARVTGVSLENVGYKKGIYD